jgi:hypothetical protein
MPVLRGQRETQTKTASAFEYAGIYASTNEGRSLSGGTNTADTLLKTVLPLKCPHLHCVPLLLLQREIFVFLCVITRESCNQTQEQ